MKYIKLFENWNETQGDGFKYYDDKTLELAEEILRNSFKKVNITAEDGNYFADYYKDMYIDPRLEKIADKYNMYWDWKDAGAIILS